MLTAINNIAKIDSIFAQVIRAKFNSTLPISLKVLKEIDPNKYLLNLGNRTVETKSFIPLEKGARYWGEFKNSEENTLQISNLLKKPDFEQKDGNKAFFTLNQLQEIFSKKKPKEALKKSILHKLSITENRNDFMQLSNMLLSLQENIFFIPFTYEKRKFFFQFRKKQKNDIVKKENAIEFYASFKNLGPVKGIVKSADKFKKVILYLYYEKSEKFLKEQMRYLDMDSEIYLSKDIKPLFESCQKLLDIKG